MNSRIRIFRRNLLFIPALTGLLAGLLLVSGCQPPEEDAEAKPVEKRIPRVEVDVLEAVPFSAHTTLLGETNADELLTVSAEAPGRILAVNYEEGELVKKGQWLARVEANVDRTRVGQLKANMEQARRDLGRLKELKRKGLATESQIEQAQLGVENAEYNIRMTRAGISKTSVASPMSGIVDKVHLDKGEYANPGAPLVTIVNYDTIVVEAGLAESDLRYAKEGMDVEVEITALEKVVKGRIRRIGIQANTRNRTFPLYVEFENEGHVVRPGMRAKVRLPTEHYDEALMIPRTASIESLEGSVVFTVKEGKALKRLVKLGRGKGDFVLVKEGLKAGDTIIVVGQRLLTEGEPVKTIKEGKCCAEQLAEPGTNKPSAKAPVEDGSEPEVGGRPQ